MQQNYLNFRKFNKSDLLHFQLQVLNNIANINL
jgi:hypothetical protein